MEGQVPRGLSTERLLMDMHRVEDFAACAEMWADPTTTRHIGGHPSTPSESWARILRIAGSWELLGFGYWAVREKVSGRYVGDVGFQDKRREMIPRLDGVAELGWVLAPWARGQGYATEAVMAALGWADAHLAQPRTVCLVDEENRPSLRVAEKAGYRFWQDAVLEGATPLLFSRDRQGTDLEKARALPWTRQRPWPLDTDSLK